MWNRPFGTVLAKLNTLVSFALSSRIGPGDVRLGLSLESTELQYVAGLRVALGEGAGAHLDYRVVAVDEVLGITLLRMNCGPALAFAR